MTRAIKVKEVKEEKEKGCTVMMILRKKNQHPKEIPNLNHKRTRRARRTRRTNKTCFIKKEHPTRHHQQKHLLPTPLPFKRKHPKRKNHPVGLDRKWVAPTPPPPTTPTTTTTTPPLPTPPTLPTPPPPRTKRN